MTSQSNSVSVIGQSMASPVVHAQHSSTLAKVLKLEEISNQLTPDISKIITSYLVEVFGADEWKQYFRVIVAPLDLPEAYFRWAFSADVLEPSKSNSETHLPPVLCPERVTELDKEGNEIQSRDFSLRTMHDLLKRKKDSQSGYFPSALTIIQSFLNVKSEAIHWCVMRKEVCARGLKHNQQKKDMQELNTRGAGYEVLPQALNLITVISAIFVRDGERYLGDATGKEGYVTYSRCLEQHSYSSQHMDDIYSPLYVGFLTQFGQINILHSDAYAKQFAIAAVRKFY